MHFLFPKELEEIETKRKKEHQQKRLVDLLTTESTSEEDWSRLPGLRRLLDAKIVDVNFEDERGRTPLIHALRNQALTTKLLVVKTLVTAGADVNRKSPLFDAVNLPSVNLGVVKYLVEKGADVNDVMSPLRTASIWGHLMVVKFLLEKGADVNKGCESPLILASENGHVEVVKVLVEAGADLNKTDRQGRTPLHIAVEKGHLEMTHMLVKAMYKL